MKIKLNWMKVKNFKGMRNFTLTANGNDIFIFGDNNTGKTTLMDSFRWLLFDKDSTDRTAFKIKPQDENGNDINNLQIEVEAELLLDDKAVKVKKMQEEKWTKRRGSETVELTGNTVSYWWDEVPVKAGEFKTKVTALIDEEIFKMITDPLYFNTKKSWQDRRKILFEMSGGDVTDEQVIEADKSLSKLKEILKDRNIDDYKKVIADKLKGLKKEQDDIPPRIDELTFSLPQGEIDYSRTVKKLEELKITLDGIEFIRTSQTKKAEEIAKKYQQLGKMNNELNSLRLKIDDEFNTDRKALTSKKSELEDGKFLLESGIRRLQNSIEENNRFLENNALKRQKLLSEWEEYKETKQAQLSLEFIEPTEDNFICPTCGQDLPTESKELKLADMRSKFEAERQKGINWAIGKLEDNKNAGLNLKENTENLQNDITNSQKEIEEKQKALEKILLEISEIDRELQKPVAIIDYSTNIDYVVLQKNISSLQIELDKPIEDNTASILERKAKVQSEIDECNKILNNKDEVKKKKIRIQELKKEEVRIGNLIAELEGHKFLLEKFVVSKANMLEDKINSIFKAVKFKMFDIQVNGGVAETCEALVNTNGSYVPFPDANSAGRINAGIDCINALNKFYDVSAPIFIDNRESVVRLIDTDSQVISLVVSEADKELRVD